MLFIFRMKDMETWIYAITSAVIISIASLVGILFLGFQKTLNQKLMVSFVSFAAASMLGNAFLHFLPELIEHQELSAEAMGLWIIGGVLIGLITEKLLHWNHCHHGNDKIHHHAFAQMSLVGDFVHNLIDGMVIGASFLISVPAGIGTSLAILLHEIPQEIGDFAVLLHGGYSKKRALLLNFLTALSAVIGVIITLSIGHFAHEFQHVLVPIALGMFVYIAGTDLIPEINKHNEDRKFSAIQVLIFIAGVALMFFLSGIAEHSH